MLGVDESESAVARRKVVVNNHLDPLAIAPEPEAKDATVLLRMFLVPLLIFVIRNNLNDVCKNGTDLRRSFHEMLV